MKRNARFHCGWNMSFTGSTVHIHVITSVDMVPEGIDGLSCLSVFQLKVFPYNHHVYGDARTHFSHISRYTAAA